MLKKIGIFLLALNLALFALGKVKAEETSVKVELPQLRPGVRAMITNELIKVGGTLDEINLIKEDDETWYEVDFTQGKRDRSFTVGLDGKLLSWQVFMGELPLPVRKAINARFEAPGRKAKIEEINRVYEDGKITYEVDLKRGTNEFSCTFSNAGKVLSQDLNLEETPAPVRKTIEEKSSGGVIKNISMDFEDGEGEPSYDVDFMKNGKKESFTVTPDGKLEVDD